MLRSAVDLRVVIFRKPRVDVVYRWPDVSRTEAASLGVKTGAVCTPFYGYRLPLFADAGFNAMLGYRSLTILGPPPMSAPPGTVR